MKTTAFTIWIYNELYWYPLGKGGISHLTRVLYQVMRPNPYLKADQGSCLMT